MKKLLALFALGFLSLTLVTLIPACSSNPTTPPATPTPVPTATPLPGVGFDTSWADPNGYNQITIHGSTIYAADVSFELITFGLTGSGAATFTTLSGGIYGVAVDASGNVYVSDAVSRLYKFPSGGGTASATFGTAVAGLSNTQLHGPYGVCVDAAGDVFVADSSNSRVVKLDSSLNFVAAYDGTASGTPFTYPYDVQPSGTNIYVMDFTGGSGNNRVVKMTTAGAYGTQWGTGYNGTGNSQFNYATHLAVSPTGNVYVTDSGNNRVQVFDANGNFLEKWGTHGTGNSQFGGSGACQAPQAIAFDYSTGKVYVVDADCATTSTFKVFGP